MMEELTRKEEQMMLAVHFLKDDAILNTIRKRIKEYTGKDYSLGTIYVPLNRLHMNGYLKSTQKKVSGSNKPVRYYSVTSKGIDALSNLKENTDRMWEDFTKPVVDRRKS